MSNTDKEEQNPHEEARRKAQEEQFFADWTQIRRQGVQSSGRMANEHGMSASQFNILGLLERMEGQAPCTIRWLSQSMSLDPATVVRAVDHLESQGLVARRRDTKDRRQVFVEFTEAGRQLQEELRKRAQDRLTTIFHSMSEEGRAALLQGLREFVTLSQQVDEARME